MILPAGHTMVLIVLFLGMLAWGTWANTLKAAGEKWRFELYCFDFAIGVVIASLLLAVTFGSLGFDGFSFMDDLRLAGKRQDAFAFGGGVIFNLGNMLLLGSLSVAGMSVAFSIGMGVALVMGVLLSYATNAGGNAILMFTGAAAVIAAVITSAAAYRNFRVEQMNAAVAAAPAPAAGKTKVKAPKPISPARGIALAIAGGVLVGLFAPLLRMARQGENGLGPYSAGFFMALGIFFSTFVYNLFFMNLPVKGDPIEMGQYFRAPLSRHGMGLLGGILWYGGTIAALLQSRIEGPSTVQPAIAYALSQGGLVIAVICGLLLWHEFGNADTRIKTQWAIALFLLVVAIGLVSSASPAPAY